MSLVHNIVGGAGGGKPATTDAVLRVTAPSGSTVTIKKGTGASVTPNFYLDGTDTDEYFFYIKVADFGEYTVTATLGDKSKTETITIETPKEYIVEMHYEPVFIKDSVVIIEPTITDKSSGITISGANVSVSSGTQNAYIKWTADVTYFTTLYAKINKINIKTYNDIDLIIYKNGTSISIQNYSYSTGVEQKTFDLTNISGEIEVAIRPHQGSGAGAYSFEMLDIYIE